MPETAATIPSALPGVSSGCETADQIICADEVQPGDLAVFKGVLCAVEDVQENHDLPAFVGVGLRHSSLPGGSYLTWMLRHHLVAVRRYVTTEED
jgi:hypothetical protein